MPSFSTSPVHLCHIIFSHAFLILVPENLCSLISFPALLLPILTLLTLPPFRCLPFCFPFHLLICPVFHRSSASWEGNVGVVQYPSRRCIEQMLRVCHSVSRGCRFSVLALAVLTCFQCPNVTVDGCRLSDCIARFPVRDGGIAPQECDLSYGVTHRK